MPTGIYDRTLSKPRPRFSEETKRKISLSHVGVPNLKIRGENNYQWKKVGFSYVGLHQWIKRTYGVPFKCENKKCVYPKIGWLGKILLKPKRYHWAKIRGKKYERKRENYIMLCPSCHIKYDKKSNLNEIII